MDNKATKNFSFGMLGTLIVKSISYLTVIIVGLIITPAEYGRISMYTTWITIFSVFVGMQLNGSLQNAYIEYGEEKFDKYCTSILCVSFMSFLSLLIPFLCFRDSISALLRIDDNITLFLIPQCFGAYCVGFLTSYFLTQKKVINNLIFTLSYAIFVACISLLLCYVLSNHVYGYVVGCFIPNVVFGIAVLLFFFIKTRFCFNKSYILFSLKFSIPLIMHTLSSIILSQSDKIMINFFLGDAQTGNYNMVHNYSMLVNTLWASINGIFIPYYFEALQKSDKKLINEYTFHYYVFFSIILFGYMLVGKELIMFITREKYSDGLIIFPVSVLSQYYVFQYSFSSNFEFFKKKTLWIAIGTFLAAFINIVLNYFMISNLGIFGAAIASAISYLLLFIFHECISRFYIKDYPINIKFSFMGFIISLFFVVVTYLTYDLWIVRWILGTVLGIILITKLYFTKRII